MKQHRTVWILFSLLAFAIGAAGDGPIQEWGLTKGGTITGTFVRYYSDTLELRDEDGKIKPVDINTLSLESIRLLIPTISQSDLDHPVQRLKGFYDSKRERNNLLQRARFFDTGRRSYGRLFAYDNNYCYFEDISGVLFARDSIYVDQGKGLLDYVKTCVSQIPPGLNEKRMKTVIAPWKEEQRLRALENRVNAVERTANEALRESHNNTPGNSQIPPGFRPVNGTWVSP